VIIYLNAVSNTKNKRLEKEDKNILLFHFLPDLRLEDNISKHICKSCVHNINDSFLSSNFYEIAG